MVKKVVGLGIVLLTVVSIPNRSMALVGDRPHDAYIINGAQVVPVGVWRFTLDQPVFTDSDEACAFFVRWYNPTVHSSANAFVEEVTTVGAADCDENAFFPQSTFLRLSTVLYPNMSKGFDKFQQKRPVNQVLLGENGLTGEFTGIIQFHPTSVPYGFRLMPR